MANIGFNSFNAYSRMSYGLNTRQTKVKTAEDLPTTPSTPSTPTTPSTPSTPTTTTGTVMCSTFNFDNYTDFWRTLGKGVYKKGDTVTFKDAKGELQTYVARDLDGQIIFDNGTIFIKDQAR